MGDKIGTRFDKLALRFECSCHNPFTLNLSKKCDFSSPFAVRQACPESIEGLTVNVFAGPLH